MGLFRKAPSAPAAKAGRPLATNAPSHWPPVVADAWDEQNHPLNLISTISSLSKALDAVGRPDVKFKVGSAWLFDEGIIEDSFDVLEGEKSTPVFVCNAPTPEEAARFWGAAAHLTQRGTPPPVYYSTGPLPAVAPASPFREFGADLFRVAKPETVPKGQYCMWWGRADQMDPRSDRSLIEITRSYQALEGVHSYIAASFGRQLEIVEGEPGRIQLPEDEAAIPVEAPEGRTVIMAMGAEKGIRFAFNIETTPVEYRERFLKAFADYCAGWRREIDARGYPHDPPGDYGVLGWWQLASSLGVRSLASGEIQADHMIQLGNFGGP